MNIQLVLLRHGESEWNQQNKFTGWTDIDLTDKGKNESKLAGNILKNKGFVFNKAYTSMLKRAIHTLWILLDELNQPWLSVEKSWRLNERHYGFLQGLNKNKAIKMYGDSIVQSWRRGYHDVPPSIKDNTEIIKDIRYSNLTHNEIPNTESLQMTTNRVKYYLTNIILKDILNYKKVIIVAHGNSIRAIIKILQNLNEDDIFQINIPTAVPLIYEFDYNMNLINHFYLYK